MSDNIYAYERKVAGYDAYTFFAVGDDEKIHSAGYSFMNTYTVGSQYISQYNILKKSLTENVESHMKMKLFRWKLNA